MIAGGQVESEFGKFRLNLRPGEDEKYHEITAVVMKDVTKEFCKYDLEEINQEFLNNASSVERNYILPKNCRRIKSSSTLRNKKHQNKTGSH